MKTSIEQINGQPYTVVWHTKIVRNTAQITDPDWCLLMDNHSGDWTIYEANDYSHIATALPALPKHPKTEDAPLLYRYMAEGVMCRGKCFDLFGDVQENVLIFPQMESEITHAITPEGNRIEIPLIDKEAE